MDQFRRFQKWKSLQISMDIQLSLKLHLVEAVVVCGSSIIKNSSQNNISVLDLIQSIHSVMIKYTYKYKIKTQCILKYWIRETNSVILFTFMDEIAPFNEDIKKL